MFDRQFALEMARAGRTETPSLDAHSPQSTLTHTLLSMSFLIFTVYPSVQIALLLIFHILVSPPKFQSLLVLLCLLLPALHLAPLPHSTPLAPRLSLLMILFPNLKKLSLVTNCASS